jgi:hypothetical protein
VTVLLVAGSPLFSGPLNRRNCVVIGRLRSSFASSSLSVTPMVVVILYIMATQQLRASSVVRGTVGSLYR